MIASHWGRLGKVYHSCRLRHDRKQKVCARLVVCHFCRQYDQSEGKKVSIHIYVIREEEGDILGGD